MYRPYVYGFVSSWVANSEQFFDGETWRITGVYGGITTYQQVTFRSEFMSEYTNHLTFDHILSDYYYLNVPGAPLPTLAVNLRIVRQPSSNHNYFSIDSLGFPDLYWLTLPPYPTAWGLTAT